MRKPAQEWWTGLAALLALAVVLVWSPVDQAAATSHHHAMHAAAQAQAEQTRHGHPGVTMDADCGASALDCCLMAQCCPGITVGPQNVPVFAGDDSTTAATAVETTGSGPGIVLPPPRRPSV